MQTLTTTANQLYVKAYTAWGELKQDERGEGLVSFLIIAVAVAALALVVLASFDTKVNDKINDLDLNNAPTPTN